jgi:type IV secretory pathway VirB2 component (pilin)
MPVLHVLATLLLAPYVALAILLLAFGHATSQGSLWGFIDTLLNHVLWIVPFGILGFGVAVIVIAALGIARRTRAFAGALLCALGVVSPIILVAVTGSRLDADALIFLAPCLAVAIFGGWRLREEWRAQHGGRS